MVPATQEDLGFLVGLRNEEVNARFSKRGALSKEEIERDYLANRQKHVYIAGLEGQRAGYVILAEIGPRKYEVSVAISPAFRGRRLGRELVTAATRCGISEFGSTALVAEIYSANVASLRVFQAQGYELIDDSEEPWTLVYREKK